MLNDASVASRGFFKDKVCTTRINKEKKFKIKFQVLLKFTQILPDYEILSPSDVCQQFLLTTFPKPLGRISPNFIGMIHGWSPFKVVKKSIPGRILVAMATKRKNFKNLAKNYWSDFKIIWCKWSLSDPLPKLFKLF